MSSIILNLNNWHPLIPMILELPSKRCSSTKILKKKNHKINMGHRNCDYHMFYKCTSSLAVKICLFILIYLITSYKYHVCLHARVPHWRIQLQQCQTPLLMLKGIKMQTHGKCFYWLHNYLFVAILLVAIFYFIYKNLYYHYLLHVLIYHLSCRSNIFHKTQIVRELHLMGASMIPFCKTKPHVHPPLVPQDPLYL